MLTAVLAALPGCGDTTNGGVDIGPASCTGPSDCDDDNACTMEMCVDSECRYTNATGACDDGDICTTAEHCIAGVCTAEGACSALECPEAALETYLMTTTVCLSEEAVRAALPENIAWAIHCNGVAPCTTGCAMTVVGTVETTFVPAAALGDLPRLDAVVNISSLTFSSGDAVAPNGCVFTATMTGGTGSVSLSHHIENHECISPPNTDVGTPTLSGFTFADSSAPRPGSTHTQDDCDNVLGVFGVTTNLHIYYPDLVEAWAGYGRPNCRACGDGCSGGLRCEVLPPP